MLQFLYFFFMLPLTILQWGAKALCFEFDTEPYALTRDGKIKASMQEAGVRVVTPVSHTIFDPAKIINKNGGKPPLTYQAFCKRIGQPSPPVGFAPDKLPPLPSHLAQCVTVKAETDLVPGGAVEEAGKFDYIEVFEAVPTLSELGYSDAEAFPKEDVTRFQGGETEALRRLDDCLSRTKWVKEFEKPKGDPSALAPPATTVLSPYLKFGCLSSRLMYARIQEVLSKLPGHTKPPVSLIGQLLWREFFYTAAYGTPHFDRMQGSSICRQIPWKVDSELLAAWRDAQTGFPWIDAIMVQLRQWGWMHHLARHCVACFLTRGDLLVHWELGRDVFDRLLVDADWAINNGNWLWLSASAFFSQYHRIYSPVTFGKKYDPSGKFIRHFLPVLKDMPSQYIYEPWTAPLAVQCRANCIIGKDYPRPSRREGKKKYGTDGKEVIEEEENGGVKQRQRDSDYETSQNKKGTEEEEGGGEMGRRDATVVVVDGESSMLVLEGLVFYCQGREGRGGRIERGEGGERGEGETSDGEGRGGDGGGRGSRGASFQSFHAGVEAPCARVEVDVCAWVNLATAARSDELWDSVDYGEIYSIARRHVESHQPPPLASLALPPLARTIATTIRTSLPRVKRVWSLGVTGCSCSCLPAGGGWLVAALCFSAPVAALCASAPVAALCASAPVPALCASAPVAALCASAPVAALCASAPVAALCASAPVAALCASAPVAALCASAPVAALRASAPVAARSASAAPTGKLGDGVPRASDKAGLGVDSKAPTGRLGDGVSGASEKAGPLPLSVDSV
ncbi:unnamed protein product [Closterium sp. Naga37s-1]|nr:unnamed protein product [Closterium sp. Naga37s-1]